MDDFIAIYQVNPDDRLQVTCYLFHTTDQILQLNDADGSHKQ